MFSHSSTLIAVLSDPQNQVLSPPEGHFAHFLLNTLDGNEVLAREEQASRKRGQDYKAEGPGHLSGQVLQV